MTNNETAMTVPVKAPRGMKVERHPVPPQFREGIHDYTITYKRHTYNVRIHDAHTSFPALFVRGFYVADFSDGEASALWGAYQRVLELHELETSEAA